MSVLTDVVLGPGLSRELSIRLSTVDVALRCVSCASPNDYFT